MNLNVFLYPINGVENLFFSFTLGPSHIADIELGRNHTLVYMVLEYDVMS